MEENSQNNAANAQYGAPQGTYNPNPGYPQGAPYGQAPGYNQQELEEPMKLSDWLITMLIQAIPCVGLIMTFVWAFSKTEKKSKSNYCKAMLIWYAVALVITTILYSTLAAAVMSAMNY